MMIKRFSLAIVTTLLVSLLPGCGCSTKKEEAVKKQGLFVVNVLDKAMYDDCHIKGSIQIPLEEVERFAASLDPEKAEVVVYCSNYMCTSSEYAVKKFLALGFKHVWAYEGGMAEWYQLGLPVEGPAQQPYLSKKVEKPADEAHTIPVITAQELAAKLEK
ncbi:MAG TPA: rhodanese-like domain-containing protein [Candidatus Babeliales bacterium]|nr:rhodanese-like domain-containing protein [Candidatus Babeliales bacterium]